MVAQLASPGHTSVSCWCESRQLLPLCTLCILAVASNNSHMIVTRMKLGSHTSNSLVEWSNNLLLDPFELIYFSRAAWQGQVYSWVKLNISLFYFSGHIDLSFMHSLNMCAWWAIFTTSAYLLHFSLHNPQALHLLQITLNYVVVCEQLFLLSLI